VISDTDFFEGNRPAICLGVRGITYVEIDVVGPNRDLLSGAYGGAVQNPVNALCEIVGALKGRDGRIEIPGFYDDVTDLSPQERAAIDALPFDEVAYRESLGLRELFGEASYSTVERKTARRRSTSTGSGAGTPAMAPR
jgi:acetylornithine deacetylase/succinyl-diaminopimelate desuccinylase-like protein